MNLTGKVFIITGALGALGQAVTVCLTAHGAKLALLGNRVRPGVEHPAGALIYTGVDLSRKDAASAIFNRANMPDADFTRWVSPLAVAEATAFLVSDLARDISGAALPLAGRA